MILAIHHLMKSVTTICCWKCADVVELLTGGEVLLHEHGGHHEDAALHLARHEDHGRGDGLVHGVGDLQSQLQTKGVHSNAKTPKRANEMATMTSRLLSRSS